MNEIIKLLQSVPAPIISAIVEVVQAVLASKDPERTARRHAKMIAAKTASEAIARKLLP